MSVADSARPDLALPDTDLPDTDLPDTALPDTALPDTALPDTDLPDSDLPDTALPDTALPDTDLPDSDLPDSDLPDSDLPDTTLPDTTLPDLVSPDATPRTWWNLEWSRRRRLTIDNSQQATSLTSFPIMVRLDSTRVDYGATQDNGEDLRFVAPESGQPLAHEIEEWDEGGESMVWVNVPLIDAGFNRRYIWMYYGNSSAPAAQDPSAVWSADFEAVFHLHDNVDDSSASGIQGNNQGSVRVPAHLADGRELAGAGDFIDLGQDLPLLMSTAGATLSAWVRPAAGAATDTAQHLIAISQNGGLSYSSRASMSVFGPRLRSVSRSADGESNHVCLTDDLGIASGSWSWVAATIDYSSGMVSLYVDGVPRFECRDAYIAAATPATLASYASLGAEDDGSTSFLDGVLDEARVARVVRSPDWIQAQHLSMTDAMISFGVEELF